MHVRAKSSWTKHIDFIILDVVVANISLWIAYILRHQGFLNMYANYNYRAMAIAISVLEICLGIVTGYYSGILKRGMLSEAGKVVLNNIELSLLVILYMFVVQTSSAYSRVIVLLFWIFNTCLTYLFHLLLKFIHHNMFTQTATSALNMLIVAQNRPQAEDSIEKLQNGVDNSHNIVGVVLCDNVDTKEREIKGIPIVSNEGDMYDYACKNVVDEVLISLDPSNMDDAGDMSENFLNMGIMVNIKMNSLSNGTSNVSMTRINDLYALTSSLKEVSRFEMFVKRAIDICAGVVGCIITGILFIFLAPAIKILDPSGPIFFVQERIGRGGRKFKIYKFRSMYSDAEERKKDLMGKNKMDGMMFKIDEDPRVIGSGPDGKKKGFGHFIRSTSLDEFPNFWSILKGDMSLVGTRPPTIDEYEKYEPKHNSRLAIKPGLTGMWQAYGRSDITDFEKIVQLDNIYIRNWSFWLDVRIVLKTVVSVLKRKGAE